jgi:hypothetical protein
MEPMEARRSSSTRLLSSSNFSIMSACFFLWSSMSWRTRDEPHARAAPAATLDSSAKQQRLVHLQNNPSASTNMAAATMPTIAPGASPNHFSGDDDADADDGDDGDDDGGAWDSGAGGGAGSNDANAFSGVISHVFASGAAQHKVVLSGASPSPLSTHSCTTTVTPLIWQAYPSAAKTCIPMSAQEFEHASSGHAAAILT